MLIEAGLRAFFFSATAALGFCAVVLICRGASGAAVTDAAVWSAVGGCFGLCFATGYGLWRPSWKQTAVRVDDLGLGDAVTTMVEFHNSVGAVYDMQREDTLQRLRAVPPERLRIHWPRLWTTLTCCMLTLVVALATAPTSVWQRFSQKPEAQAEARDTEEARLIREMLQGVAEQIDASELSEEEKQALHRRLQELMDQIAESGEMGLAALASAVSETDVLLEDIGDLERLNTILGELMKTSLVRDLAMALTAQDENMTRRALGQLEGKLLEVTGDTRRQRLEETAGEIQDALSRVPGAERATLSSDYLSYCFGLFVGELRLAAQAISVGVDGTEEIKESIRQMTSRLITVLTGELDDASRKVALKELLAQKEAEQAELQAGGMGGEANGTGGDGPRVSGQMYTVGSEGVSGGLEEERERYGISEMIYDPEADSYLRGNYVPGKKDAQGQPQREVVTDATPLEGNVSYQQVFGVYYAKVLEQLEGMPEASLEALEMYFDGLLRPEKTPAQED